MSDSFDANQLAALYVAAHKSHVPVEANAIGAGPQSFADVYAVQSAVMREIGPNGGFKTARPDPTRPNVYAPIVAANVRPSPARVAGDEMRCVGIEIEIAFRIDSALPALASADYDAQLRSAVSAVAAIELVDTRLADWQGAGDMVKLADNQSGFGLIVGEPVKDFAALNLVNPTISLTVDDAQIGATAGQIPGDVDAFQVLKDLLEVVGDHCGGVRPGMYVTTGALSGLHWADKGGEVAGDVAGLGRISVEISG